MLQPWKIVLGAIVLEVVVSVRVARTRSATSGQSKDLASITRQVENTSSAWRRVIVQPGFGGSHGLIPLSDDSVLVSDTYQNSRAIYQINASTGQLSLYLQSQLLYRPSGLVFSPDGRFLYVCDVGTGQINMHRTADRVLYTQLPSYGRGADPPWNARYVGNEIYYVTFRGNVRRLSSQGDVQVGSAVPDAYDLVRLSSGHLIVTSMRGVVYRIDAVSNVTSKIAAFGAGSVSEGLDAFVDRDGREKLVVADTQLSKIYKVDPENGAVTVLLDGNSQPGFRLPINVRTRGQQVFVNAQDLAGNMLLLVGNLR